MYAHTFNRLASLAANNGGTTSTTREVNDVIMNIHNVKLDVHKMTYPPK